MSVLKLKLFLSIKAAVVMVGASILCCGLENKPSLSERSSVDNGTDDASSKDIEPNHRISPTTKPELKLMARTAMSRAFEEPQAIASSFRTKTQSTPAGSESERILHAAP